VKALVTTEDSDFGLRMADVPEPEPRPGQALVEVRAVAVNRGELSMMAMLPPGSQLGWDIAGTVLRPAADGSGPAAGTRVTGLADGAGWSELAAADTARLTPVPDDLDWTAATAIPVVGLTALYALRHAGLVLGRTVLVTGAGGGVGRTAVQLAAASGGRVVAWVGSAERAKGLRELGAAAVSTYDAEETGPVDVLVDSVGGQVLNRAYRLVVPGGKVIVYGNTTRSELNLPVDWGHARPGVQLRYVHLFHELPAHPVTRDLGFLVQRVADGLLDPQVATVAPWTDAEPALRALAQRQVNGKVVLTI
jgi:NADPH2:quinone reductase